MLHDSTNRPEPRVSERLLAGLALATVVVAGCSRTEATEPPLAQHVRVLDESPRDYTGMTRAEVVALLERKIDALEGIADHLAERGVAETDLPSMQTKLDQARKEVSELALEAVDDWAPRRETLVREIEELERRLFELAGPLIDRND